MLKVIEEKIKPFKHHLLTISFIGGFVLDNLTLNRVDQVFDNLVLVGYVLLASCGLIYLYLGISGKISEKVQLHAAQWAPLLVQFAFGGLMSGILVFYSRSGSWYNSWPYLLVLIGIIFGNEFIKRRAQKLVFNLSVLFVGAFSYAVLTVPVLTGEMGAWIFVGSGVLALLYIALLIKILYKIVPNFMALNTRMIFFTIGMVYFVLNFLYFTNVIPPIPLSLKDIGIYHNVERLGDGEGYRLTYEEGKWYQFLRNSDEDFRFRPGDTIFCFASVFAPTRLSTTVYHHWEKYDENVGDWVEHSRISYPIGGGRDGGFRGFTSIQNVTEGEWRCTVETARGQVIGREKFYISTDKEPAPLTTRVSI